jgi:uncharacterized protein (PEP-CTERM system associated)
MTRPAARTLPFALGLAAWCAAAWPATDEAPPADTAPMPAPPLRLEISASLLETLTDNAALTQNKRSDAITEARVSLHGTVRNARMDGFADYTASALVHARDGDRNDVRQWLTAQLATQLVPQTAFVDFKGDIAQSSGSAFETQTLGGTAGDTRADRNRFETATASVSPYVVAEVRDLVDVQARYALLASRSRGTDLGDHTERTATLQLGHRVGRGGRWGFTASSQHTDYVIGRDTVLDTLEASLAWQVDPDLELGLLAGQQRTDLASLQRERNGTWGATLRWTPSERTKVDAQLRHTFFGHSHSVQLSHRTPRTAWSFSDARDLSSGSGQADLRRGSAYDLMFQQFATLEPDAARRDQLVRNFLAARGIDPRVDVASRLLVSAVTLQHERALSGALNGVRSTLLLRLARSDTRRLSSLDTGAALGDLAASERVRQDAASLNLSHQMSPTQALNLLAAWSRNRGDLASQASTLKTALATWNWHLSPRSTLAATLRHARFDSPTAPYRENALTMAFTRRF